MPINVRAVVDELDRGDAALNDALSEYMNNRATTQKDAQFHATAMLMYKTQKEISDRLGCLIRLVVNNAGS